MKKILLANIGNRNLNFQNKPLAVHFAKEENTVKAFSEMLLDKLDEVKNELSVQILPELLEQNHADLAKVILYGSDQKDASVNDQDTIFVASILERLLADKYPEIQFETRAFHESVVDNNALLIYYRNQLLEIKREFPKADFIICDAGGTAQQKSSLKIMAEFVLTSTRYETFYQNIKTHKLEKVKQVEYRRVITQEQVTALVNRGEYAAALTLYRSSETDDQVVRLLQLGAYRKEMLTKDALSQVNGALRELSPWVKEFKAKIPNVQESKLDQLYQPRDLFPIRERLEWACYAYELGNLTASVLGFQVFSEYLVSSLVEIEFPEFGNANKIKKVGEKLIEYIRENEPEVDVFFPGGIKAITLPVLIKFAQTFAGGSIRNALREIENSNSYLNQINRIQYGGLDELRNRIAHDGEGITPERLSRAVYNFPELLKNMRVHLALSPENGYQPLNQIIVSLLREGDTI